jgi:hypothetical protein
VEAGVVLGREEKGDAQLQATNSKVANTVSDTAIHQIWLLGPALLDLSMRPKFASTRTLTEGIDLSSFPPVYLTTIRPF